MKNKVVDDNKKCQENISDTKKQFDDFARRIASLNNKLNATEKNADALKGSYGNEDFERKADINNQVMD